MKDVVRVT